MLIILLSDLIKCLTTDAPFHSVLSMSFTNSTVVCQPSGKLEYKAVNFLNEMYFLDYRG